MLLIDHAAAIQADRERDIRAAARARMVASRPSIVARIRARIVARGRTEPTRPVTRSPRTLARELGDAVSAVSARASDTHGQGAC
jgi:hypothetical protein